MIDQEKLFEQQNYLANKVLTVDSLDIDQAEFIGGVDIAPLPLRSSAVASLVVVSLPSLTQVYEDTIHIELTVPYISGLLGFREVPAYQELLARAASRRQRIDICMVDGFGILHHRRCGSASHLGIVANVPTIGIAKNLLHVDGLTTKQVRQTMRDKTHDNDSAVVEYLHSTNNPNDVLGAAVCRAGTAAPIYVSIGHRVSLTTAVDIVLQCCKYKIPEPLRLADILCRKVATRG